MSIRKVGPANPAGAQAPPSRVAATTRPPAKPARTPQTAQPAAEARGPKPRNASAVPATPSRPAPGNPTQLIGKKGATSSTWRNPWPGKLERFSGGQPLTTTTVSRYLHAADRWFVVYNQLIAARAEFERRGAPITVAGTLQKKCDARLFELFKEIQKLRASHPELLPSTASEIDEFSTPRLRTLLEPEKSAAATVGARSPTVAATARAAATVGQGAAVPEKTLTELARIHAAIMSGESFSVETFTKLGLQVSYQTGKGYQIAEITGGPGVFLRIRLAANCAGRIGGRVLSVAGLGLMAYDLYQGAAFVHGEARRPEVQEALGDVSPALRAAAPVAAAVLAERAVLKDDAAAITRQNKAAEDARLARVEQARTFNTKALAACAVADSLLIDTTSYMQNLPKLGDNPMEIVGLVFSRRDAAARQRNDLTLQIERAENALVQLQTEHSHCPPTTPAENDARNAAYTAIVAVIDLAKIAQAADQAPAQGANEVRAQLAHARQGIKAEARKLHPLRPEA